MTMSRSMLSQKLSSADLYVVITESFCAGRSSLETLENCLAAGVRLVQLREKHLDDGALFALAREWRARTRAADAVFIVDDRVDIALAADADGVHLGQSDLPIAVARELAPELLIGASSHTPDEAMAAQEAGADYVNIGPVFPTRTKETPMGHVGPELISDIAPRLRIPFTCMGGIKLDNLSAVMEQGAQIAAVVTAVTAAEDQRAAAQELRTRILELRTVNTP